MNRFRTDIRMFPILVLLIGCDGVFPDRTTPSSRSETDTRLDVPVPTHPRREAAPAPRELLDLEITPAAARELKASVDRLKLKRWWLRFTLEPGGCTGFRNKLDLDAGPPLAKDYEYVANDGIACLVLKSQRHLVQGTRIDFGEIEGKRGFIVTAPHASQRTKDAVAKWITDEFHRRNPDLVRPNGE